MKVYPTDAGVAEEGTGGGGFKSGISYLPGFRKPVGEDVSHHHHHPSTVVKTYAAL